MIAVIDYGLGNLRSVAGAVEHLGFEARVTRDPGELARADRLILPGVGAFGDGMRRLHDLGLVGTLSRLVLEEQKPILGICLGCQLMCRESPEFGRHEGLGWIAATVVPLAPGGGLRVPHVGWNDLFVRRPSVLFAEIPERSLFYYVHSFRVECADEMLVTGDCEYGIRFTASFEKGRIFGTQFHPEKSQQAGLLLLKNFLTRV